MSPETKDGMTCPTAKPDRRWSTTVKIVVSLIILLLAALMLYRFREVIADVLEVVDPGTRGWALAVGASLIPLVVAQAVKQVRDR
jgi:hypothetical protein